MLWWWVWNTCFEKAEQRYFAKLRKALKLKEAIKITLYVINLVALQCVKFKIKIKNFFFTVLHGMEHTMTHMPHMMVKPNAHWLDDKIWRTQETEFYHIRCLKTYAYRQPQPHHHVWEHEDIVHGILMVWRGVNEAVYIWTSKPWLNRDCRRYNLPRSGITS